MNNSRRRFIKQSGSAAIGATLLNGTVTQSSLGRILGNQTGSKPTLVVIYLRGGADALNVVIPYKEKKYAELRPTIALPGPDTKDENRAIPLDDTFALNPNLKGFAKLYEKGQCAPIICVGSPHPTRSHFSAQDYMERAAPGMPNVTTGWLNRYLEETKSENDPDLRSFVLQPQLPRSLRGTYPVVAMPRRLSDQTMEIYKDSYNNMTTKRKGSGQQLKGQILSTGKSTIANLKELNRLIGQDSGSGDSNYPKTPFGARMSNVAKIIKANKGTEVTALDYGGWDHHQNEGPINGALGTKLADLGDSITAFADDLGERMERVLVLVMSEFGRTVRENGNNGTDHGHGGAMFAIGRMISEKKTYGTWNGLEDPNLYKNRDLPVNTDFRSVFAESIHSLFGFDGIKAGLFPKYSRENQPLNFLRKV